MSFPIGLLSSPIHHTGSSLVQLQQMAKPAKATGKEETHEENIDGKLHHVLVPFVPATFYANYANHVAKQLYLSPLSFRSLKTGSMVPF
ncbi:hypothetical protein DSO57_1018002 [Entomophthora muscae]|uniref:Uncharacterized protein n=1 Tax=Entomophthora muscae TaxID=34485 RepID=A0ACC2ST88_9FUNG|nr:hypothetical protein DSO57_1018002 [Entomophthora muscae]